MRSKRKISALVIFVAFVVHMMCTAVCFFTEKTNCEKSFYNKVESVVTSNLSDLVIIENPYDIIEAVNVGLYDYPMIYPAFVNVAESLSGELVASSGFAIKINDKIYDIDSYFTNDMRADLEKKLSVCEWYSIYSFKYTYENDKLIPVKITFSCSDGIGGSTKEEFIITDKEETETLYNNVGVTLYLYRPFAGYEDYSKSVKAILYENSELIRNQFVSEELSDDVCEELYEDICEKFEKNTIYSYRSFFVNINDVEYVVDVISAFDPVAAVLHNSLNFEKAVLIISIIIFFMTVTALVSAEIILNKRNKLEEAKYAFTNAVAHELKTPVAVIENQCECILEEVNPEKNTEYISTIYKQSIGMAKLVNNLLQYNKIYMSDKIIMDKVNISDIAMEQVEVYSSRAEIRNIKITADIDDELYCECNRDLLGLVMDNFLSNAVKYASSDSEITVSLNAVGKKIRFSVFNIGSSVENKNIWNLLTVGDKSRSGDANGMGLAISSKILKLHKCSYGYINRNNGVEFYFITR